jgi:hypothetical protein
MPPRTKLALVTRTATRSVAIFAAALVLAGQLAAAAHFHPIADREGVGTVTQLSADGGLCALCLLAFHTSAAPAAPASSELPIVHRENPWVFALARWSGVALDIPFGRAPPASL